jgi:peptidoglycan/xylan/chitin deacetylase (PgdA/CDA1 family)
MKLSIIMYHYVRDLRRSRFPALKAVETEQFRAQIAYITEHYNVISGEELLAAAEAGSWDRLPPSALLLTFDDGYVDHFTQVFPILRRANIPGCFFPPARCILDDHVLDVNKIHFVLASVPDKQVIVDYIFRMLEDYGSHYETKPALHYWTKLAVADRFDPKEILFIKRILQRELPEELRRIIIDRLFQEYVSTDEVTFARELYMSLDQIECLRDSGMFIGSHGFGHYWLGGLDPARQKQDVELGIEFLHRIGAPLNGWIMSYPYGAYDDGLLSILGSTGCRIGLTTQVGIADLGRDNLLTLPRLDTNDLPPRGPADAWALQAAIQSSAASISASSIL